MLSLSQTFYFFFSKSLFSISKVICLPLSVFSFNLLRSSVFTLLGHLLTISLIVRYNMVWYSVFSFSSILLLFLVSYLFPFGVLCYLFFWGGGGV